MTVDKEKNTQVLVTISNEMLQDIENYWHANKLKNRNEAIRQLIASGLKNQEPGK